MTKKQPTVKNVTKELKKFLRERGCLRAFRKVIRVETLQDSLESFVKEEIRFSKIDSDFHISNIAYIVVFYKLLGVKLHSTLLDWKDHYYKTFKDDN